MGVNKDNDMFVGLIFVGWVYDDVNFLRWVNVFEKKMQLWNELVFIFVLDLDVINLQFRVWGFLRVGCLVLDVWFCEVFNSELG